MTYKLHSVRNGTKRKPAGIEASPGCKQQGETHPKQSIHTNEHCDRFTFVCLRCCRRGGVLLSATTAGDSGCFWIVLMLVVVIVVVDAGYLVLVVMLSPLLPLLLLTPILSPGEVGDPYTDDSRRERVALFCVSIDRKCCLYIPVSVTRKF